MYKDDLAACSAAMIAGCEAALDAEVFYQDEFKDFVVKHMDGYDCKPVFVEAVEYDCQASDYHERMREIGKPLAERIKASPRGHYAVICRRVGDGRLSYSAIMSAGSGKMATGGSFDGYEDVPPGEKVLDRMVGYEIYTCRQALEEKRRVDANVAALNEHGFLVGQEFKNYRHPGDTKRYSKAVIEAVYPETGRLKLLLTRRGSAKRWNGECGAAWFAEEVGVRTREPEKHPFIVVKTIGNDLFA